MSMKRSSASENRLSVIFHPVCFITLSIEIINFSISHFSLTVNRQYGTWLCLFWIGGLVFMWAVLWNKKTPPSFSNEIGGGCPYDEKTQENRRSKVPDKANERLRRQKRIRSNPRNNVNEKATHRPIPRGFWIRRMFSRYDKLDVMFTGFILLAMICDAV